MLRERITDDIYIFTSQRYAQVTAGAILTDEGAILIDTLFYPDETAAIKRFVEDQLAVPITHLINTHYHADHTNGNYLFPEASIFAHALCCEQLNTAGRESLHQLQATSAEFQTAEIVLPHVLLHEEIYTLTVGGKTLQIRHTPGHSADLLNVFLLNDRVLFASDNIMPIPTLFDGAYADLYAAHEDILKLQPDVIVQGHGEVILRGRVQQVLDENLHYLATIKSKVNELIARNGTGTALNSINIDIESCGKSRLPLQGLVVDLHQANLYRLHREFSELLPL